MDTVAGCAVVQFTNVGLFQVAYMSDRRIKWLIINVPSIAERIPKLDRRLVRLGVAEGHMLFAGRTSRSCRCQKHSPPRSARPSVSPPSHYPACPLPLPGSVQRGTAIGRGGRERYVRAYESFKESGVSLLPTESLSRSCDGTEVKPPEQRFSSPSDKRRD